MGTIAFVTTAWGPRHGGINAFNTDLCSAVADQRDDLRVICVVLRATDADVAEAARHNVKLVAVEGAPDEFAPAHKSELREMAHGWPDLEWWVGHDIHSGPVAVGAAESTSVHSAVIQHTDHISYAALRGTSGERIIERNRRETDMLKRADAIFGVGPTLAEAAGDRLKDPERVAMLLPGLAPIEPLPLPPPTFRPITFGRLAPEDDLLKRGTLAVLALAQLVRQSKRIAGRDPRMTVIGIERGKGEEERLRGLAEERANRLMPVNGVPFTEDRELLFHMLQDASVCLMLSLHEGFGLVGWEAIAAGVPLILTRNSGLHRLLEEYRQAAGLGRVFSVDVRGAEGAAEEDITTVTDALEEIALHPDIAKARALALRELFSDCTWDATARTFLEALGFRPERASAPALRPTLSLPKSNLRVPADEFVDPPGAAARCALALAENRLVTLVGPPGAGKTRFAIELARSLLDDFDGHVYFVDLTKVADPELVVSSITRALSVEAGEPITDALKELFRGTRALLVLDSFERVLTASHAIRSLLEEVPDLTILATSQVPLGLDLEHDISMPVLPLDRAAQLFLARAADYTSALPSADDPRLERLCERLDCLPQAIELVAPRIRLYPTGKLLDSIEQSLRDVAVRQPDLPAYQRALHAAFEWSYEQLERSQRRLFAELSVFAGGCTIETAASVLRSGTPYALEDDLLALLDKRLLRDDARGAHRFVMPTALRTYAAERLKAEPDANDIAAWHAAHFLAFAEAASAQTLEVELENLAAALRYLVLRRQTDEAMRLAVQLAEFWWSRDFAEGWARLCEVRAMREGEPPAYADFEVHVWAGRLAIRLGKQREAEEAFDRARVLAREPALKAQALAEAALVPMERAEFPTALRLLDRALAIQRELEPDDRLADTLDSLGVVATDIEDYATAGRHLHESLELYKSDIGAGWVHNDLARLGLARNQLGVAAGHANRALAIGARRPDWALVGWARNYLGLVASAQGELNVSREHHDASLKLMLLLGDRRPQALVLEGFAALAVEEKRPERALQLAGAAEAVRAEAGIPRTGAEATILERRLARGRDALGAEADAATAAGRALSLDEAAALARAA